MFEQIVECISRVSAARSFADEHFIERGGFVEVMELNRVALYKVTRSKVDDPTSTCRLVNQHEASGPDTKEMLGRVTKARG